MGIFGGGGEDDSVEREELAAQKRQLDAQNKKIQMQRLNALKRSLGAGGQQQNGSLLDQNNDTLG